MGFKFCNLFCKVIRLNFCCLSKVFEIGKYVVLSFVHRFTQNFFKVINVSSACFNTLQPVLHVFLILFKLLIKLNKVFCLFCFVNCSRFFYSFFKAPVDIINLRSSIFFKLRNCSLNFRFMNIYFFV